MEHRKTPAGKALTLPGWVILLCALVCLSAVSYYGFLLVDDQSSKPTASPTATPNSPATTAPTTATPTPEPTTATTPTPKPKPKPKAAPVQRNIPVGVYNNTRTTGLARSVAARVEAAGWTVSGVGNWRGSVPATTVYYPPGFEKQAQTLARDLDFDRVRPLVAPMRTDRLTLVLSGPQ